GDEVFVPGFDDLPLASGLVGGEDGVMVFDTPGGRIVEARVAGPGRPEDVMAFYEQTLPQLGWTHLGKGRFAREGEILIVEAVAVAGGESPSVTVRFQLSPESR
ncbi:MAG: hypothetical protein OQJ87_03255, partial [Rhodospirillales bacterium]|nr:hypothetical protein [Rhodospirillales bacterium]